MAACAPSTTTRSCRRWRSRPSARPGTGSPVPITASRPCWSGPKGGADQPFRIEDLAGKSVGVVADSEFAAYLETLPVPPDIRTYNKLDEADLDLLTGRIAYVLGDKLALSTFLASREGEGCCRAVADLPVDRGLGVAVAVRKGDRGLAQMFDAAIAQVMKDGTYDRIRAKYIPFDIK